MLYIVAFTLKSERNVNSGIKVYIFGSKWATNEELYKATVYISGA